MDFLYPNMIKMNCRPANLCERSEGVSARKEENARMEGNDMSASFVTQQIDYIESEVYKRIKPLGFRKHGRTLHRFVSGDISQVISFQSMRSGISGRYAPDVGQYRDPDPGMHGKTV